MNDFPLTGINYVEQEGKFMKAKIIAGIGIVVLAIALIFAVKPKSFDKIFGKVMSNMDSYILAGDMEITKGEDVKSYTVEVGYKKANKDLFRVALVDKELNQEQIILRNNGGVYVVTPSLNQIFKFEGDWPMNSPKPYLLQSIADIVKKKEVNIKKEKDGYLVSSKVMYPNNKNFDHEDIMFDKDAKVKWLQIYNKDNGSELKIVFNKADYNAKIKDDYFKEPTILEKKASTTAMKEADLPLYPVMVHNAKLKNTSTMKTGGEVKHVLEYAGEKNFTVVETKKKSVSDTQMVIMPGQMIDTLDLVGFYDGNHLSAIYDNVEFTVFSDDLGPSEMLEIINSMQVAVMK